MPFDTAGFADKPNSAELALYELVLVRTALAGGKQWLRHKWRNDSGGFCLMGALAHIGRQYDMEVSRAVELLWQGVAERCPHLRLPPVRQGSRYILATNTGLHLDGPAVAVSAFNDGSASFAPVRAVLRFAIARAFAESGLAKMPRASTAAVRLRREVERQLDERQRNSVFKCIVRASPRFLPSPVKEMSLAV